MDLKLQGLKIAVPVVRSRPWHHFPITKSMIRFWSCCRDAYEILTGTQSGCLGIATAFFRINLSEFPEVFLPLLKLGATLDFGSTDLIPLYNSRGLFSIQRSRRCPNSGIAGLPGISHHALASAASGDSPSKVAAADQPFSHFK